MRTSPLLAVLLTLAARSAPAQTPGTFEIGGFGRYTWFDDTLSLDDKAGGGGTLGIFVIRNLALEAEGAYTTTSDASGADVSNEPIRGRLTYHIPLGGYASAIRIGAGYVRNMYRKDVEFDDDGATGVLGLRWGLGEKFALQVDGTIDYVPSPDEARVPTPDDYMNLGVQAGAVLLFGNSYDKDKDGVKDKVDQCPGTPAGEAVDASGCGASQRDSDRDGVKDNADKCPNTASGAKVDANGCAPEQLDKDNDGVIDGIDKCLDTPAGEQIDSSGCSASQRDSDGDGVKDNVDKCPETPAGEQVNVDGCGPSQLDSDADGVMDSADKCPNTPTRAAVDENGCPRLFEGEKKSVILQGVTFATGKAELTDDSKAVLIEVARSLVANPGVRVQVGGHTDNTGSRATNMRLSTQRAKAVETFLEANGVSPGQVTSKGFGPDKPIASNKTAEGRAQNRRVELNRID
jgi:outer membrane protein OmpA-like peptidoglycan-associated protein